MGNKTVAQSTNHFPFVSCRGEFSAGLVRVRKETVMQTFEFCKKLAMQIMANKLNDSGVAAAFPMCTQARRHTEPVFIKRLKGEGKWSPYTHIFEKWDTLYICHMCFN